MSVVRTLIASALGVTLAATAHADESAVDSARLAADIRVLASDAFEGRSPGTVGEEKTLGWIIGRMIEVGLEPAGDVVDGQRTWTQDVPLARFVIDGDVAARFDVGGERIALVQGEHVAIRPTMTGADRAEIADAPVVFAGYGVRAPERDWDDFAGVDVKGKVVLVLVNDPDFESGTGDFGGKAMTYYGRWTYKYEEAARLGAAGLFVIHEDAPAAYGWLTVKNSNTVETFDIARDEAAAAHPALEAWIRRDVAADVLSRAGYDFEAVKKQAAVRGFRAFELPGVRFSTAFDVGRTRIVSKNVAGVLPGTTRSGETLVYTAHWDHLGVGVPDARGDTIYNGAVDNASGVAALLELARLHEAAPRTARSILFLALTAEERGLLGSEYYAANPLYPLETTVANVNIDGMGMAGPAHDFGTSGDGHVSLQDDLIAVLRARGRTFTADARPEAGLFFRSDHFPLAKRGVPAISVRSGQDLLDGGAEAGKAAVDAYVRDRYHQPADEWSDDWDLTGLAHDIDVVHQLGHDLATSTRWPEWQSGSEFKAIRDASAATRR